MAQKFVLTAELQFRKSADVDRFVSDIKKKFSDVDVRVRTTGTREAINDMRNLRSSVNQTNSSVEQLAKTFALSFKRFVSFSVATRFVSAFTSKLDAAFRKSREFEAEMIKISQVTGKSMSQLSDLTGEINRLATGFGVYSNTLAKVSVMLSQAGFSARDTKIALDALAKSELSPTFDNIISTTEGAIAIFNQFGSGAENLSKQLGQMNAIAGKFAVESGDLIEVVRRVGGVFKSSGGSLEELMALFTSVRQTTRENAESIATALRTIFVRIQRPKTIDYLKKFNIELRDEMGRFVGPLEAIERIYEKFGNLPQGDIKLIEAGEVLAGFRQIGKFIPLIQQYKITQEALNVAKAGENSLDEDSAKAKEGLANKLSRLNEEFLLLIRNISESKSFKVITDFFINTTSAVIKLVDALKPLIPLFTAFAGIKLAKTIGTFSRSFTSGLGEAKSLAFNSGGSVPGYGNTDTVPTMLTPGEFVLNKRAAKTIGSNKLHQMNKSPQRLNKGGWVVDPGTVGIFTLDPNEKSNAALGNNFQQLRGSRFVDRTLGIADGFPIKVLSISNNKTSKSSDTIKNFDEISTKYLGQMVTELVGRAGNIAGIKPFEIDQVHKNKIIEKFSNDKAIKATTEGYLLEGFSAALLGIEFEGGQSSFDFDFKKNKNVNESNFEKLFGENFLPGMTVGDAKRSVDLDKIREKSEGFIKSASAYTNISQDGSVSNPYLESYGFRYVEEGLSRAKNIGKSIDISNLEANIEELKKTKYFNTKDKSFVLDGRKIPIGVMEEIIKSANNIESKSIRNKYKFDLLAPDENSKEIMRKRIVEIFEESNLSQSSDNKKTKIRTIDRSLLEGDYSKSSDGAIGYLDTDLMRQLGDGKASQARNDLMQEAIKSGIPITNIIGMSGSGKSTLAHKMGGNNLYPVTQKSDLKGLIGLINVSSEVTKDNLDYLSQLSDKDKIIFLSSSTQEEMDHLEINRLKRDLSGSLQFGRKAGSSSRAPKDSRVSEALIQQYVKAPTEFRSASTGNIKGKGEYTKYDFLEGSSGAQSLGSFNPTTLGHVLGLTQDMVGKGVKPEDYLIMASKGQNPVFEKPETWRTSIFGDKYRKHLAKIGFGEYGFYNVESGSQKPSTGFVDQKTGKVKIFNMALNGGSTEGRSTVVTGGKTSEGKYDSSKKRAESAGQSYIDVQRSSSGEKKISGTLVRKYLEDGRIEELKTLVPSSVYKSLLQNQTVLQNRSRDIQSIISLALERNKGKQKGLSDIVEQIFNENEKYMLKFAGGGHVPGTGNRDTVQAMLTPGEYVLNKSAVASLGVDTLNKINKGTKQGKASNGVRYYSDKARGGFEIPGGGFSIAAGLSVLSTVFSQLAGEGSAFGKVLQEIQVAGVRVAGSYYIMSEVVSRASDLFEKDVEGNIVGGLSDIFRKNDRLKNKIDKTKEDINVDRNKIHLLDSAKPTKKIQKAREEYLLENKSRKLQGAIVPSDEEIAKLKELNRLRKEEAERISNITKKIQTRINENEKNLAVDEAKYSQGIFSRGKDKFNNYTKDLNFKTSAGRAKIAGLIGGSGSLISSGAEVFNKFYSESSEKSFKKGDFTNARSSLSKAKVAGEASEISSSVGQGAALGATFGPWGAAIGGAVGGLVGFGKAIANHSEKLREIDFKIVEESVSQMGESLRLFKEGLIDYSAVFDKESKDERRKSRGNLAKSTVLEAERRGQGYIGAAASRTKEFFQYYTGGGDESSAENYEKDLAKSIFNRDLNAKERGQLIQSQAEERNISTDAIREVSKNKSINLADRKAIIEEQVREDNSRISESRDISKKQIKDAQNAIKTEEAGAGDKEVIKKLNAELALAKTMERSANLAINLNKQLLILAESEESLFRIYNNRIKVESAFNAASMLFNRALEEGKNGINVYARAIQESEYSKTNIGRADQFDSANKAAISKAEKDGLIPAEVINYLKTNANSEFQLAKISDEIRSGGFNIEQGENARLPGSQIIEKLRGDDTKIDPKILSTLEAIIDTEYEKLSDDDKSNPEKLLQNLESNEEYKKIRDSYSAANQAVLKSLSEFNNNIISVNKERISAERQFISEISNSINLIKEAEQISSQFGGKAFTPARERGLELSKLNSSLKSVDSKGINSLDGNSLLAVSRNLSSKSGRIDRDDPNAELNRERLKTTEESLVNAGRANIDIRKKEIEIIKAKNKLEQDAIKSLAQGDVEAFFNNIQGKAATDALARGDESILTQLGPKAISTAVENLQSMQSAGINEYEGRSVGGLIRQGEMSMTTNLMGQDSASVRALSAQNAEISVAESDIRKSAEVLSETGVRQEQAANMDFQNSVMSFSKAVDEFKKQIAAPVNLVQSQPRVLGGFIFRPKGSDTVPAMLTPGEFVVRKSAVNKIGIGNLNRLNQGYYNKGGVVGGRSEVYNQAGSEQFGAAVQMFKESVSIFKDAISIGNSVQVLSGEIAKLKDSFMDFANTNMSVQLSPTSVQVNISDLGNSMRQGLSESAQQMVIDRVIEELKRGRY